MHRVAMMRRWAVAARKRSFLTPVILGLAMWVGFPTVAAYQDMASLVSGADAPGPRWGAVVEKSVAGSLQAADMPFRQDGIDAAALSGAGLEAPGIGTVALRTKPVRENTPDEVRVNRADKRGRLLQVSPVAPPKVVQRRLDLRAHQFADEPGARPRHADGLRRPAHHGQGSAGRLLVLRGA